MTEIASESFTKALPELMPLFIEHWRETGLYRDTSRMKPSPELERYQLTEQQDDLLTLVARQNGAVVGYLIIFGQRHLHYRDTFVAITDLPYVHSSVRNRGIGVRLFLAAEKIIKERGIHLWQSGSKINSSLHPSMDRLLRHMKFEPTDLMYNKWLGE